jgi:hypothetical protein
MNCTEYVKVHVYNSESYVTIFLCVGKLNIANAGRARVYSRAPLFCWEITEVWTAQLRQTTFS